MAGILDLLNGGGAQNGLLEFLRNNAINQQMVGGLPSDTADYGRAPMSFAPPPMAAPQAQPSPLDTAQWPAGPVGAPSSANASMQRTGNVSLAVSQPAAASDGHGFGDRLMLGTKGFLGNLDNGPIGALAGGLGALVTGQPTDPSTISAQKEARALTANERALQAKGVDPAAIQAAMVNPDLMKTLFAQAYGAPKAPAALGNGYIWNPQTNKVERAYEPDDKTPAGFRKAGDGLEPIPNGPADPAYLSRKNAADGASNVGAQVEQRRQAAAAAGITPDHPAYQGYILTGKMPREDAQPLSATDKKAILEADEGVLAANTAISALKKAKELSPKALGFKGAGTVASVGSMFGNDASEATVELDNTVMTNALGQLKAIFGGAPTEGERAILLQIQGSSSQPDAVRQKIYDRAMQLAEARLKFNEQRAAELRGGTFYKAGGGKPGQAAVPAAPAAGNYVWTPDGGLKQQ